MGVMTTRAVHEKKINLGVTPPTIVNARAISTPSTLFNVANGGNSTSNNLSILGSSAYVGATVNVYLGGVLQGTATTASDRSWNYPLGVLADAAYTAYATLTTGGITSPASSNFTFTVVPGLTSLPVAIGSNIVNGNHFYCDTEYVQTESTSQATGHVNANCCIPTDTHTLQFTNLATDAWPNDGTCRSDVEGQSRLADGQTFNVTYEFLMAVSNPTNDAFGSAGWFTIGDIHDSGATSIPYNNFCGTWANNNFAEAFTVTTKVSGTQTDAYEGTANMTRGVWHTIDMVCKCVASGGSGMLTVILDGTQIVNFSGAIGGISTYFWKHGVYRGGLLDQTQIVSYRNFQMRIT